MKKVEKNNVSFERSSLDIYSIMFLFCFVNSFRQDWGISSNGRAPALHAGGTGIDARILHISFFLFPIFLLSNKNNERAIFFFAMKFILPYVSQ